MITNGPWKRSGKTIYAGEFAIATAHAFPGMEDEHEISNAQLIATAPKMLSALKVAWKMSIDPALKDNLEAVIMEAEGRGGRS